MFTLANLWIMSSKELENLSILKEDFIMEISLKAAKMEKDCISTEMVIDTPASGKMARNMAKGLTSEIRTT